MPLKEWPKLAEKSNQAPHVLLALDYDGTLAPFHTDRMKALPLSGVPDLLRELAGIPKITLAIVSGRPIRELSELLGDLPAIYIGSHGWEVKDEIGIQRTYSISDNQKKILEMAVRRRVINDIGFFLEKKVASVAFHTRKAAPALAAVEGKDIFHFWSRLAGRHSMECRRFDGGVELRCMDRHKGTALREIFERMPKGTLVIYIGDDDTDEDVFRFLKEDGVGIKVGSRNGTTHASYFLADCSEVRQFLTDVLSILR